MDNVSHSLAGWALSRAGGARRPPGTTLALVLASNLPDLDFVLWFRSEAEYLLWHRGLTHSLLGLAVLPPILALGLWWGLRGRTRLGWLLLLSYCGTGLHLVWDLVTSWGTMLLYPFAIDRLALDWLFIVDPVTWALPAAALLVARWRPARARAAVVAMLVLLGSYGAAAGALHASARRAVAAAAGDPLEVHVFPRPLAPARWAAWTVTDPGADVGAWRASGLPPAPRRLGTVPRGLDDPWARRALATRPGQSYLWWARVPVARTRVEPGAAVVELADLRFAEPGGRGSFGLRLRFDPETGALLDAEW